MSSAPPKAEVSFSTGPLRKLERRLPIVPVARKMPLRTLGDVSSRFGVGCAAKGVAYRVARRVCQLQVGHVLVQNLAELSATPAQVTGLEYRWLTADEVRAYACDPANDLEAAMAPHLEDKRNFCFAALDGRVLANYSWYALDSIPPEHSLGAGLSFPPDTVYFYKAYTRPDYRGRGVHPTALSRAASFFAERGISRLIAIIEYANWPSLRSHAKLGFRDAGRFVKAGRPPWRFERYPQLTETLGIRFGGNRSRRESVYDNHETRPICV